MITCFFVMLANTCLGCVVQCVILVQQMAAGNTELYLDQQGAYI
jgi:hypothetical protein